MGTMYDRRAIMTAAHRDYESRVVDITALTAERNARIKKSKASNKPALIKLGDALRSLWKTCLRTAWADAKRVVWLAAQRPQTEVEQLRDAIGFEEAADRGYDAQRVAALRAQITTLRTAA